MANKPLYGWRVFRNTVDKNSVPILTSYTISRFMWEGPAVSVPQHHEAELRWLVDEVARIRASGDDIVSSFMENMVVGFHSYRTYKKLIEHLSMDQTVCAKVVNYGLVHKFEHIYRAEKSMIVKLFVRKYRYTSDRMYNFLVRSFQKRYQCDVKLWKADEHWAEFFYQRSLTEER